MTIDKFEYLQAKMVHVYRTQFPDHAKEIVNAIEQGNAASMFYTLIENVSEHSLSRSEKVFNSVRLSFFFGCCLHTNNGIPMIEVVSDWIDNSPKEKTANAAWSQITLFDFLLKKEISINILADYIENRDIIEYATGDEKKSTGVLKKILDRKRAALNNSHSHASIYCSDDNDKSISLNDSTKCTTNDITVPVWALYYWFLQNAKYIPYFENLKGRKGTGGKKAVIIQFLTERGHKFSHNSFKNIFEAIGTGRDNDPLNSSNINTVINLLEDYPIARQNAKNQLYSQNKRI